MADEKDRSATSPEAAPAPRGRSGRRMLARLALMLLLVLALLAGAVLLFPDKLLAPLLVHLARTAAARAGGDLTVASLRGGLSGPWVAENVRWRALDADDPLREVRAGRAEIAASLRDLVTGRPGWLQEVRASGVDVRLDLAGARGGGRPPGVVWRDLMAELPSLRLDALSVSARRSHDAIVVSGAALELGPRGEPARTIALDIRSLRRLRGGPDAGADAPSTAVHGRFAWSGRSLLINEFVLGGGPLDGFALVRPGRIELDDPVRGDGHGELTLRLLGGECPATFEFLGGTLQVHARADDLDLARVWRLATTCGATFAADGGAPPRGRLMLAGDVVVPIARPHELTATLDVEVTALELPGEPTAADVPPLPRATVQRIAGRLALGGGEARLQDMAVEQGANRLTADDLRLPYTVSSLRDVVLRGTGRVSLLCRDLPSAWSAAGGAPITGRPAPEHELRLAARLDHGVAELQDGVLTTPGGSLAVTRGRIDLSGDSLLDAPLDVDARADFADLSPLGPILGPLVGPLLAVPQPGSGAREEAAARWSGSLGGSVHAEGSLRDPRARLELSGERVIVAGWPLGEMTVSLQADRRTLELQSLSSTSGAATLQASGRCALDSRELADAKLSLNLEDASRLPVEGLAGTLSLEVQASGPLHAPTASLAVRSGGLSLPAVTIVALDVQAQAEHGRVDVQRLTAATSLGSVAARGELLLPPGGPLTVRLVQLDASHEGLGLALAAPVELVRERGLWRCDFAELAGSAGRLRLQLGVLDGAPPGAPRQTAELRANALRPVPLLVGLLPGGIGLASLDGELSLQWGGDSLKADGELRATALRVALDRSIAALGPRGVLADEVSLRVALAGPAHAPQGTLELAASGLRTPLPEEEDAGESPGPSSLVARVRLDEQGLLLEELLADTPRRVHLDARGRIGALPDLRALVAPLSGRGASRRLLPPDATLDGELRLSAGDLGTLAALFTDVRRVEGAVSTDLHVRGTLADPVITGVMNVEDGELRLATGFPALDALQARLQFDGRRATIRDLRGELGGSPFEITGGFELQADGPKLDIALRGDDLLLYRGEGVKIRADTDMAVSGPLRALSARGSLALRDSRFARNLNFLHVAAMTNARPGGGLQLFSFEEPPLSTMALDVRVTALEPVVIDNNLAQGGVLPDLHLGGTGAVPLVVGGITISSLRVALPAGVVTATTGRMDFSEDNPFRPTLDISAQTSMRGYEATILVRGPFDQPLVSLSSVPPLPADELLLLVLTGQPPGDASLVGAGERGTFAVYLGQDLLARWMGDDADERDELIDRFDVEISREVSRPDVDIMRVSFRLSDQREGQMPLTFLGAEKDIYDKVNYGIQFLYRIP